MPQLASTLQTPLALDLDLANAVPADAPDALRKALIGRRVYYESLLLGGAWYTHPTPVYVSDAAADSISVSDPEWQRPLVFRAK